MQKRALLIVLDSVGAGALPDAALYGDEGANTIGHIAEKTELVLPNLRAMGLGHIEAVGLEKDRQAVGGYGRMMERSAGKDTTTGHWELAGVKLDKPFPTFPNGFPAEVIGRFEAAIGVKTLGNIVASGTEILDALGEEHMRTGRPIVYTSADSVFQIACHEGVVPLEKLYGMCETARRQLAGDYAVGRVIARPFVGERRGAFTRTAGRRDYSLAPPRDTVLDALKKSGRDVLAVGKIEDIFAHRGITDSVHAAGNPACIEAMMAYLDRLFHGLCFVNLVDFDMVYGHRRNVQGYADALMAFDRVLPTVIEKLNEGDLLMITADHGCDPTHRGTDHTREYAPMLARLKGQSRLVNLGTRASFADAAATVAEYFGLAERFGGASFLRELEG